MKKKRLENMEPQTTPKGLLLLDKPKGKTSFFLVGLLRRLTGVKKIGHAGTLDPFATGVMVMLIGKEFTKMSDQFLNHDKEYLATLHLGIETDSYDIDGKVTFESPIVPPLKDIEKALSAFQGQISQIPPMFSAKKIGGKKLYELARQGKEIERKPSLVTLKCDIISYNYPHLVINVACSKGTYIRSFASDLGKALGCGAHLSHLIRTKSGPHELKNCLSTENLTLNAIAAALLG